MCGRYTITSSERQLAERFSAELTQWASQRFTQPRYNAAPSQLLPVVINDDDRRCLDVMQWGLISRWAKAETMSAPSINARIETVTQRPAFRESVRHRRSLVPADGFYEWQKTIDGKVPMRIATQAGRTFAFAGIWDEWLSPDKQTIRSFAILTAPAVQTIKVIHDRMPVILEQDMEDAWLHPASSVKELLATILSRLPNQLQAHPVSKRVNSARHDDETLIEPVEIPTSLF